MKTHSPASLYRFSALPLVGQALRLSRARARLFFLWSLPAFFLALASAVCGGSVQVDPKEYHLDTMWVSSMGLAQLSNLFFAPLGRSVCRLVRLGEMPDRSIPAQLFMGPTWRYIVRNLLAHIQCFLLAVVFAGGLSLIHLVLIGNPWEAKGASSLGFFMQGMVLAVALSLAYALLISRMALVRPAAAVGREITLKNLGRLGAPSRWSMIKVMLALWGPLWGINCAVSFAVFHLKFVGSWLMAWSVLEIAARVALGVVELVACALIYDHVIEARHEELARARGQEGADAREPAPGSSVRSEQAG